ncbi:unnamed protein product [Calypogeia fissa]
MASKGVPSAVRMRVIGHKNPGAYSGYDKTLDMQEKAAQENKSPLAVNVQLGRSLTSTGTTLMETNIQSDGGPTTMNQMVVVHTGGPGGNNDVKMTSEASQKNGNVAGNSNCTLNITFSGAVIPDISKWDEEGSKTEVTGKGALRVASGHAEGLSPQVHGGTPGYVGYARVSGVRGVRQDTWGRLGSTAQDGAGRPTSSGGPEPSAVIIPTNSSNSPSGRLSWW